MECSLESLVVIARSTSLTTSAQIPFTYNWMTVRELRGLVFRVRACSDARILLAFYMKTVQVGTYEIVLGSQLNSWSTISKNGTIAVQANTPMVLNCQLSVSFWVSWWSTFLEVGTGANFGENGLLAIQDPDLHKVRAVSLDTVSPVSGEWDLGSVEGQESVVTAQNSCN